MYEEVHICTILMCDILLGPKLRLADGALPSVGLGITAHTGLMTD
jgi:hypothetical protein